MLNGRVQKNMISWLSLSARGNRAGWETGRLGKPPGLLLLPIWHESPSHPQVPSRVPNRAKASMVQYVINMIRRSQVQLIISQN